MPLCKFCNREIKNCGALAIMDLPKINAVREQNQINLMIVTEKNITKEFICATFV